MYTNYITGSENKPTAYANHLWYMSMSRCGWHIFYIHLQLNLNKTHIIKCINNKILGESEKERGKERGEKEKGRIEYTSSQVI